MEIQNLINGWKDCYRDSLRTGIESRDFETYVHDCYNDAGEKMPEELEEWDLNSFWKEEDNEDEN